LAWGTGCGAPGTGTGSDALKTTLNPPPGPFNDVITVTLTSNKPAQIFVTTDETDPHVASLSRLIGQSPMTVDIKRTTTLKYFARTAEGVEEPLGTAEYIRAGGKKGTVTGTIIVGSVASNTVIDLRLDRTDVQMFPALGKEGEIPFELDDVATGDHRLTAISDRNNDGNFFPLIDYTSDAVAFSLDLNDPFHASAEGIKIYLGASPDGLCTIEGTITVPKADIGQDVAITALSPSVFTNAQGGGNAAQDLLAQLQHAYNVFATADSTEYPYAITNLQPGQYLPIPILTSVSLNGLGMNFLVNILHIYNLKPGDVAHADFDFGSVALNGTVTLAPAMAPTQNLIYGMVAAKNISLTGTSEAVLMPIFFRPGAMPNTFEGNYLGQGLRDSGSFNIRVFTNLDDGSMQGGGMTPGGVGGLPGGLGGGPIISALTWVINPLASEPPHATFTSNGMDVTQDITVQ